MDEIFEQTLKIYERLTSTWKMLTITAHMEVQIKTRVQCYLSLSKIAERVKGWQYQMLVRLWYNSCDTVIHNKKYTFGLHPCPKQNS